MATDHIVAPTVPAEASSPAKAFEEAIAALKARTEELHALERKLRESGLSPVQEELLRKVADANNEYNLATQDAFVEALAAHFPGLAPAILLIGSGGHGDLVYGTCCEYWQAG